MGVAVIGVGYYGFNANTPDLSWKEIMYEAATRAYADAGINPRKDVDSFITCAEDIYEGFAIFDEFVPDQLGAVVKPTCTICGDFLYGIATAYMHIESGLADVAVVEAHSKASDILTFGNVIKFAMDPIWLRNVGKAHPYYFAALEMAQYVNECCITEEQIAEVVVKNKNNALLNDSAPYGAKVTVEDVLNSPMVFDPMRKIEIAQRADGAIVFVLASDKIAKEAEDPVWVKGVGWWSETSNFDTMSFNAYYAYKSAKMAYKLAGITNPAKEIDFAEVDDRFAFKELQHLEALQLSKRYETATLMQEGYFARDGALPVNISGGNLGIGNLLEATGGQKALEVVLQLRGLAGKRQLSDVEVGVAQAWRYIPTASGAVAVFGV
ncbi:Acetyl-CoA acetyltransferase [Archaeoglobus sulfaticallidus PM70-1]|uniref:Acetyl-CoA acetyltransferase n=1 Tax=Archaeoglobus sulfaticallidus PM70-1 TaxID=387631 RepID=N0B9C2_9EURY|nr:thiolase domain-containing protein [Archaeoglobus sulfaticallidus]AGK60209.1 Acetyl-CoA acetyltransferase [Archaeoglobus sulfaticallidus PM70-1]